MSRTRDQRFFENLSPFQRGIDAAVANNLPKARPAEVETVDEKRARMEAKRRRRAKRAGWQV